MNVTLVAKTKLTDKFVEKLIDDEIKTGSNVTEGELVAFLHIRNCYSSNHPTDILKQESKKYFLNKASDGLKGNDAQRLIRQIVHSGHTSTLECLNFDFAIEGVSRSLLAQLTRHRIGFSFSVKGQRYVKMGSEDKIGGFSYITPQSVKEKKLAMYYEAMMNHLQTAYDEMRKAGVPAEDARMVLPNAATCDIMMNCNLRALLDFYSKRKHGSGAQWEIADLAEELKNCVVEEEPWTTQLFC